MGYTIFHAAELDWQPRREGDPRLAAELSGSMTQSRANLFRYPPGAVGRRHIDPIQEEVFVVLEGTLTIHMGEDGAVEEHELAPGSVLVVQPGTRCNSRTGTGPSCASSSSGPRRSAARRPSSIRSDGRLLGAGLVAGVAVHDRREHAPSVGAAPVGLNWT